MDEREIAHVRAVFPKRATFWMCDRRGPIRIVGYVAEHKEDPNDPDEPSERAFALHGGGVISATETEFRDIVHMQRACVGEEQRPVKEKAIQHAVQFLALTGSIVLPPPEVQVTPAGDVVITWKKDDRWAMTCVNGETNRYGYVMQRGDASVHTRGYISSTRVPDDLLAFFAS